MNQILIRWAALVFLSAFFLNTSSASSLSGDPASFKFSLDNCNAWLPTDQNNDFSEFTGTAFNTNEIMMSAVGGNLYRANPEDNGHSCTSGLNGTNAMCISANTECIFQAGNEQALRFDIELNPVGNKFIRLSELNFYELAPEVFSWNDGFSFINDYPTRYALRVSKNGQVVYEEQDIQCTQEWSLETYTFSGSEFTVGVPTVFNFELLAYCPVGADAIQHVWDLEDIEIKAECLDQFITNGGEITGGPFNYCLDQGPFYLPSIGLFSTIGENQQWIVTNSAGTITALSSNSSDINFAALGGTMFLQNISYQTGISGLTIGENVSNLNGTFSFSNAISVAGINPSGGTISGGPITFCVDGQADYVTDLSVSGSSGTNMQWVITDPTGLIMDLPADIEGVNFDAAGVGNCFIWNVNYETITGLVIGGDIEDLDGCFGISNGILVNRLIISGGSLSGGPFTFCVDGEADFITVISLSNVESGLTTAWFITDVQLNILGIPADPTQVNFDEQGAGVCFLWSIAYADEVTGLEVNNTVSQIEGCFGLSNSVRIERIDPSGGTLVGGPFEFCVDGVADFVSGITLSGNSGISNSWIVTDESETILGLATDIQGVNFDDAGVGTCLIWNISHTGDLSGLELDSELSDITGCFGISNSITVVRSTPEGGSLTGGPYDFCIDGEDDIITNIVLDGNNGANSAWIVADEDGAILGLPANISDVNFELAGGGICLIYNISYQNGLTGLDLDANINDLVGCYGLSNSISVNRTAPLGGNLTGGPFDFCLDDQADMLTGVSVTGNSGVNSSWLITDADLEIIAVTNQVDTIDFNGAGSGICLVWNISFGDDLVGLEAGNEVGDLEGCFALSDSIVVTRINVEGGTLAGGPYNFCVDGEEDIITDITLDGNNGVNSAWIVADEDGDILGLPANISDVDFDNAGGGVCLIYNISYENGLTGLDLDGNINDLVGCYGLSNSIAVNRTAPVGGSLTGGPFSICLDDQADMLSGISVTGNSGVNSSWLITDADLEIIAITNEIDTIDFNEAGAGICLIWNISYGNDIVGLAAQNAVEDLEGCFALSDSIVVTRTNVEGGVLTGGPFDFCIDDAADFVTGISVAGNIGTTSSYIVTDADGEILELTTMPDTIDFNGAIAGVCLIWNISFEEGIDGLEAGNNVSDLEGCFGISNSISVTRSAPNGGVLTSEDFEFMIDGMPDMVSGIVVSDTSASNFSWIVTDENLEIIGLPGDIEAVNFDAAGVGVCLIWYIGYADGLENLELNNNLDDLEGCFDISNSVTVNRMASAGGQISSSMAFDFCIDGTADMVSGIELTDAMGTNSQWIITNAQDSILGLPADIELVDFDEAGVGVCYIYHLSYEDNTTGLATGNFLSDLMGGFALSNSIEVNRTQPEGGTILGGPYSFCIDQEDDFILDLILTDNSGSNTQWIVTDLDENIITVTDSIENVNFNLAGTGTCLIWSISYEDGINGLINDSPLSILDGCFNLSNSIEVVRSQISGGTLESAPFNFCIDMEMDTVSNISFVGATGSNNSWLITDEDGFILGVPDTITTVDFNAAGSGICFIWNISYEDGLIGLNDDSNVSDLEGCFALSNSIRVTRSEPMAGLLAGGPFNFTIDGIEDNVSGISFTGEAAPNLEWVVTSLDGTITMITDNIESVNFDGQGVGECLIYQIAFLDGVSGLEEGNTFDDIEGCFDVSNSISVMKMASTGGTLTGGPFSFCVDGVSDFVSGLEIADNMGSVTGWIITDASGLILGLPNNIEVVDFDASGVGTCYIYHISYEPGITGLAEMMNISGLIGTFGLSNFVEVIRSTPAAGTLTGGPFDFCIEGTPDMVTGVELTGNTGPNTSWIITDEDGLIVGLPDTLANVNFDDAGPGICLIYSVTYNDGLEGLAVDSLLTDLEGCFALTDNITVIRTEISGGTLLGGPYNFCIDGETDNITGIDFSGSMGPNQTWIATDTNGVITHIEESLGNIDFDETGEGTCFAYNITFETGLIGLQIDGSINTLIGCFDLSDALIVNKSAPEGGTVSGTSAEFCIDDADDFAADFAVTGNIGANSSWLVTNAAGQILAVPADILSFNFNTLNPGTCFVYHISYNDGLDGLFVGESVIDLDGCFSISPNNISVTKTEPLGGSLSPINYSFCIDGLPDLLTTLSLVDTVGVNYSWVITDIDGVIIDLPAMIEVVDFDDSELGTCLVYNITFEDGLAGLTIGENIADLEGCFDFSNSVQVVKEDCVLMSNDSIIINEIFPADNLVELKNISDEAIDVSEYWLCEFPVYGQLSNLALDCVPPTDYILDPGEILVVEFNAMLSSTSGEIGLYNSQLTNNNFGNSDFIVDYVEWGFSGHTRASVAIDAGMWTLDDFVPSFSITNSIEYDGFGDNSFDWVEASETLCGENTFTSPEPLPTETKFSLYPNPGKDEIRLDFTNAPATKVNARIYNSFGQLIMVKEMKMEYGEEPTIDINNLNEGAYILEISAKGFSQTQRFIKIN